MNARAMVAASAGTLLVWALVACSAGQATCAEGPCAADAGGGAGGAGGGLGGGAGGSGGGGSAGAGGGATGGSGGTGGGGGGTGAGGFGGGPVDGGAYYSTTFPLTENPISEGGAWHFNGLDWTHVATAQGCAFSTQTSSGYDDSYALLSGFPPDQAAEAVIHLAPGYNPGGASHEVEIILRATDNAHDLHLYECNLAWNGGYAQIMLLNGTLGTFTEITQTANPIAPHDGDVLRASAIGNVITVSLNGVQIARAVDSTLPTGQPGMAFFIRPGATASSYCFKSYTAWGL
jgi:hypothetical protein